MYSEVQYLIDSWYTRANNQSGTFWVRVQDVRFDPYRYASFRVSYIN